MDGKERMKLLVEVLPMQWKYPAATLLDPLISMMYYLAYSISNPINIHQETSALTLYVLRSKVIHIWKNGLFAFWVKQTKKIDEMPPNFDRLAIQYHYVISPQPFLKFNLEMQY
ncbi:hypothetical protein SAY86_012813 [Trapa natans]|uniref:Uncharacterized protein n=1 Tax=Trapa natans TaxID=22666 RepID=A0AAN7M0C6_TRANT|nr:hypothetical protein SAY86_012813 [Trapa natans]